MFSFLLMKHGRRYDLPKGHREEGETELVCALRELQEETGISREKVALDPHFRFETVYYPRYQKYGGERVEKRVIIFLGQLLTEITVVTSEHPEYEWVPWKPPHAPLNPTIDQLLLQVERYLQERNASREPT